MTATAVASSSFLTEETVNQVRWITFNRPKQRYPLSLLMLAALTKDPAGTTVGEALITHASL